MVTSSQPSVTELFAGAGLLSEAFRQIGCDIQAAYELDPFACASYRQNVGSHIECADLARLRPRGKCDILAAGPPCQGFSTLGKRDPNDVRNSLSLIVLKWAAKLKPRIVVIENVAAYSSSPVHDQVCAGLGKLGFGVTTLVLNAADYGSCQLRLRSFTIGLRGSEPSLKPRRRRGGAVRDAWEGLEKTKDSALMAYAPKPSSLAKDRFQATPAGGDKRSIMVRAPHLAAPSWWRSPGAVTDVWGRMHWSRPSNTIRTSFQNPSKGRYVHPEEDRVITLREGARLQGIPDRWILEGSPTQVARQIGNGVPLPLGRAVGRALLSL